MPGRKVTGREATVQGVFSRTFQRGIERKYGGRAQFLVADWDGNNDRYFADKYFGVGARHILIEFKSDLDDVSFELPKKPLRRLLCSRFIAEPDKKALADSCHFLGWGSDQPNTGNISVFLSLYSKVCGVNYGASTATMTWHPTPKFIQLSYRISWTERQVLIIRRSWRICDSSCHWRRSTMGAAEWRMRWI